jgi:uncharacterized delta-60 repeat protein
MASIFSPKRTAARGSRFAKPRLEALEDRFLLSGGPGLAYRTVFTSQSVFASKELVLPDGRILVGETVPGNGAVLPFLPPGSSGMTAIELVCFNADGTLDTAFGNNGVVIYQPNMTDSFSGFALQPDGKIVVVGTEISSPAGTAYPSPFDWQPGTPYAPPPDAEYNFVSQNSGLLVARFNEDGSLDTSFNASETASIPGFQVGSLEANVVGGVTVQADGKIVIAGGSDEYGISTVVVVRLNADGSLDGSFNADGAQPGVVTTSIPEGTNTNYCIATSVAVEDDGQILVGGADFTDLYVLRFNADGTPDASFGSDGVVSYATPAGTLPYGCTMAVEANGSILEATAMAGYVAGTGVPTVPTGGLLMVRFHPDGSLDSSFGEQGVVQFATNADPIGPYTVSPVAFSGSTTPYQTDLIWGSPVGLIVQSNGDIVVAGWTLAGQGAGYPGATLVTRFNPDGTPDTTFAPNGTQFITLESSTSETIPIAVAAEPNDGFVVEVYIGGWPGFSGPMTNTLAFLQYGDAPPPGSTPPPGSIPPSSFIPPTDSTPSSGFTPPSGSTAGTVSVSDAVFASLAMRAAGTSAVANFAQLTSPASTPPVSPAIVTAPLPIPTTSQTEIVARISGGGGQTTTPDDFFDLTGESDRSWSLALAGAVDGSGN